MKLKDRKWKSKRMVAAAVGVTLLAAVFFALPELRKTESGQPITIQHTDGGLTRSEEKSDGEGKSRGRDGASEWGSDGSDSSDLSAASDLSNSTDASDSKGSPGSGNQRKALMVDVDGAVKKPGVIAVKEGDRVFQALELAGGLSAEADTSTVNLARLVEDGEKIYIPSKSEASTSQTAESDAKKNGSSPSSAKININQAGAAQLQQLPGIGPATAEKILEYRRQNGNFHKVEDLKNVSGIGEKTFARFRDKISV